MAKQKLPHHATDQSIKDLFADISLSSPHKMQDRIHITSHEPSWLHRWHCLPWIHEELRRREHPYNVERFFTEFGRRDEDQSFVAALKSCGEKKDIHQGSQLHIQLLQKGVLDRKPYLANSLVCMYAKCHMFDEALLVLQEYRIRDVYTWNALIVGYSQKGLDQEVLNFSERMQNHEGLSPDVVTLTCILKACGKLSAVNKGEQIHEEILKKGWLERDVVLGNALIDMYVKCGILVKAKQVLESLPVRDTVSWNVLIAGYVQQGQGQEALNCLDHLRSEGLSPDSVTFLSILKACSITRAIDKGKKIHDEIVDRHMLAKDVLLGTALVNMYTKCGMLAEAHKVLEELPVRNAMTWNALIGGYVEQGQSEEALKCFGMMHKQGLSPDAVTFICVLKACGEVAALELGREIHERIGSMGLLKKDIVLGTALIDMYAKCGELIKARQVLEELPVRDVVAWNVLLVGYANKDQHNATLSCFEQMQSEGCPPNVVTLSCILKACGSTRDIERGEKIYDFFSNMGIVKKDITLVTALVYMYADCGMLAKAQEVLMKFPVRDVVSWNALVAGYVQHGRFHEALHCFEQMRSEGFFPDVTSYMCALKSCGNIGDIGRGKQLHDEIINKSLLSEDIALGNALIDMHAKCGKLAQAHQLLERLHERHVVSWNALISGYVQHGRLDEAWHCFKQMQSEGLCPNVITLVCILKACGSVNGMYEGRQIHSILIFSWIQQEDGMVLGNALVDMYVKCGMVAKAHEVLRELPVCDAISWNTLIAGYVQQGQLHEASTCFEEMQRGEAVSPNSVTFLCILKVCSIIGDVEKGKQIHREIVKRSLLEKDSALSNALVDMYAKCGALEKAREVFEELHRRDIASWSVLIAGYARQDRCRDAFNCFEQMRSEGVAPDEATLICVLKACASAGAIDKGIEIHESLVNRQLLEKDVMLGTALVDMYAKCQMPEKAQQVLEKLPRRDAIAWNALIAGHAQRGKCGEALNCFRLMRSEGVSPDSVTFVCVLKACGDVGSIDQGMQIHDEIVGKRLLGKDAILGNSLVGMYAKCGALDRARTVLRELPVQDAAASWNAIIAGYVQQGCSLEALGCFEQMREGSVSADAVTFVCILKACGMVGAVSNGERIHEEVLARGLLEKQSYALGNALIDMYARCGVLGKAAQVLDSLPTRDIVAWNALVAGYAQQGQGQEALACLGCIEIEALVPDSITCLGVLTACCRSGHVDEARSVFRDMTEKYGISPSSEHQTCMVVLLGCSGQFGKALSMMEPIPAADHLGTLLALLGACQKWGNVRLGKVAFDQAVQIDRSCAAAYVLMANLFSMTGMHEDASEVDARRLMHAACQLQEDSVDFDGRGDLYWNCPQNKGNMYLI